MTRRRAERPALPRRRGAAASPFSRRAGLGLAVVGGVALAVYLAYLVFGTDPESVGDGSSAGGHRSAVGYRTLVELLQAEVPVEPARGVRPPGLSEDAPLLVLEPGGPLRRELDDLLDEANNSWAPAVVVLPKWVAGAHPVQPGWAGEISLVSEGEVRNVVRESLNAVLDSEERFLDGQIAEAEEEVEVHAGSDTTPEHENPGEHLADLRRDLELLEELRAAVPDLGVTRPERLGAPGGAGWTHGAELARPQLLTDPSGLLLPVAAYDEGLLVARLPNLPVYLVADPDLLNVGGLARGDNALVAHRLLLGEISPERWWVKEGRHGGVTPRSSVWRALLRPPLGVVTLHVALVALLAVWIAAARFGRPRPAPPRVPPGKRTLVENTARLLAEAGDPASAVGRYLSLVQESAAESAGLPAGLDADERLRRLDRLGRRRGARRPLHVLAQSIDRLPAGGAARRRRAVALAHDLYTWHQETVHGRSPESST